MSPKYLSSVLRKAQIAEFLGADRRAPKALLLEQLMRFLERDEGGYQRLLAVFPFELAVEPRELCEVLGCSRSERLRWLKEGKLPVLEYRIFRRGRYKMRYPVHDRRDILKLKREQLAIWRQEYGERQRQLRKEAAQRARHPPMGSIWLLAPDRQMCLNEWEIANNLCGKDCSSDKKGVQNAIDKEESRFFCPGNGTSDTLPRIFLNGTICKLTSDREP